MLDLGNAANLEANRRGQVTPAQRKAARVVGTAIVFVILLALPGFMGGTLGLLGLGLLAEGEWAGLVLILVGAAIVAPLGAYAVIKLGGVLRLQQDLSEGRIEQADGEVRWAGRRYAAYWEGRPRGASNTAHGLGPGMYQFYYLPRSGHLLSAAALPGLTLGADQSLEAVLRKVHRFDDGDLELNRHGRMSPSQRRRLTTAAALFGLFGVLIAGACAFGTWGVIMDGDQDAWVGVGIIVLLGVLLAALMAYLAQQLVRDAAGGSVKQVTGPVRRWFRSSGRNTNYYYTVKDEDFSVTGTAYAALVPDREYRVYYAPRSRRIVAMELVQGLGSTRGTL
jgi:hypothetical protein